MLSEWSDGDGCRRNDCTSIEVTSVARQGRRSTPRRARSRRKLAFRSIA